MLALPEDLFEERSFSSFCQDGLGSDLYEELKPTKSCLSRDFLNCSDDESYYFEETQSLIPSCSTSVASSEQSDCEYMTCLDITDDLTDRISGPCFNDTENLNCWSPTRRKRRHSSGSSSSDRSSPIKQNRSLSPRRAHCGKAKWTSLSSDEQVACLEDMIQTVSQRLGLREQLELIKMISPDANVSPTDTEYFIDLELFDDEKFSLVSEFVERRLKAVESSDRNSLNTHSGKRLNQTKCERKNRPKPAEKRNNSVFSKRKCESIAVTKTCKQLRKEKQSGLFVKEEVISLYRSRKDSDCDDEIDIIT